MPSHQMVDSQLQLRVIRPVKLYASYSFVSGKTTSTITTRLDNGQIRYIATISTSSKTLRQKWVAISGWCTT
jgi:hypothetical protein